MATITDIIASTISIPVKQVVNTVNLLNDGATIPFISRYRKEVTGGLDEVQVTHIRDEYNKLQDLQKRKETILKTIEEQEKLTPELKKQIEQCFDPAELEDIYLPYKPKRKTKASVAREKGLEPLAKIIMKQQELDIEKRASQFITDQVASVDDALQGARDIIAEWVSENIRARDIVRNIFKRQANIYSSVIKAKKEEGEKYLDYFDWQEPLSRIPSHRYLAIRRGEEEGILKVVVEPEEAEVLDKLEKLFVTGYLEVSSQVRKAVHDSYKRLIQPSMENEFKALTKEKADGEAIRVFASNLRQLLMASPLGEKAVLAIDPGYRTGCKVVCLDAQGNLKHNETIFPHPPQNEKGMASKKLTSLVNMFKIEAIAIGNGTASRETEAFIKNVKFDRTVQVFIVNEAGASIYSASKVARDEFPSFDVTVRGAVSIGRRLMDPLSELVKIEPKSIGVGQYQHDVDQAKLKVSLDTVVESCVNSVGVNLNTASVYLLTYVSGLGPTLAKNIIDFRTKEGPFKSRNELKKVPRFGDKAFEQSAGFLRIPGADNPLDNSAVHPESYPIVARMAKDLNCTLVELVNNVDAQKKIDPNAYLSSTTGLFTIQDILAELAKPGRDPRTTVKLFEFDSSVFKMDDLKIGMELPGIVTNITNFGAFVDVGVKQDGLVHISNIKNEFVKNPADVLVLNQHVWVKVIDLDIPRKRIGLSMKDVQKD